MFVLLDQVWIGLVRALSATETLYLYDSNAILQAYYMNCIPVLLNFTTLLDVYDLGMAFGFDLCEENVCVRINSRFLDPAYYASMLCGKLAIGDRSCIQPLLNSFRLHMYKLRF